MYHDGTCGAKSNVSNLFYSKKRILFLMTVFIQYMLYVYCMSCPCSKTNKLLLFFLNGVARLSLFLSFCFFPHFCSFSHLMRKNRRQTQEGKISTAVSGCEMGKQIVFEQRAFFLNWCDTEVHCLLFLLPL